MVNQGIAAGGIAIRFAAGGAKCDISVTAKPLALWITLLITCGSGTSIVTAELHRMGVFPGYGN